MSFWLLLAGATAPFAAWGGTSRNVSDRDGNHAGLAGAEGAAAGAGGATPGAGGGAPGQAGRGSNGRISTGGGP